MNNFLETEKIGRLMKKYAVPCVISLLVAALYNIVDQIFIANAAYLGSCGNAANNAVFPLTVVALAIAVMIGDGCCAFVSISLGAKEDENACTAVGNAVLLSIAAGAALMILYLIFGNILLHAFGAAVNAETLGMAKEYFFYITLGIPFYMFGQAMNPVIRSDGSPQFAMLTNIAGAIINIILDPIFIFVFKWGMAGAAIATVAGQIFTAAMAVWYLFNTKAVHIGKKGFLPNGKICGKFLILGICSFLAQISLVAAMAAINNMIYKYGAADEIFGKDEYSQIPMAVVGIVMKFFQIAISVVIGIAAGCIPIVGYNCGAGRPDRTKQLFTRLLLCEIAVGVAALIAAECFPVQLINIFGAENESVYYTNFAVKSFRIYLCMLPLACVNKAAFIFLQSMGKPWLSTFLSMLREVVLGVGAALILPLFMQLDGVLYSMPAADIITFAATIVIIAHTYKSLNAKIEKQVF